MKISLVAPGEMPIPTQSWGAIEILVWEYAEQLKARGHEVQIINTPNLRQVLREIEDFSPDFAHFHWEQHYEILPYVKKGVKIATTTHAGYVEQDNTYFPKVFKKFAKDHAVFALTDRVANLCRSLEAENVFVTPNYIHASRFELPENNSRIMDRTICLGKIDSRKRQAWLQQNAKDVFFVGQISDEEKNFNPNERYLGKWSRGDVYRNLGIFGSLILFSAGEVQPLVVMEALAAGLGVVVSPEASAGLDTSLPFIKVVEPIQDAPKMISLANQEVREYSMKHRDEIAEYAREHFDWKNISKYEIIVQNLINEC